MVQAIINISNEANYILNLVKAKYGLKDKSQAIDRLAEDYSRECMSLEVRPEYLAKLKKYEKGRKIKVADARGYFSSMRQ